MKLSEMRKGLKVVCTTNIDTKVPKGSIVTILEVNYKHGVLKIAEGKWVKCSDVELFERAPYTEELAEMTANTYQELAMRTNNMTHDKAKLIDILDNSVYGMVGETGEVVDIIKKSRFQGHELDKAHLKEELGDVMWYVAQMCYALNFKLSDVLYSNIQKLEARYPKGHFSTNDSINREV